MQPEDLPGINQNTLPYFITEAQTGRVIPVRFDPLTPQDTPELQNEDWATAIFAPVWQRLVVVEGVLKLVRVDEQDKRIQGLVHLGLLVGRFFRQSLLETAPFNRNSGVLRDYKQVGRLLVARLVVESIMLGGQGRVVVEPRSGTEAFYAKLGFEATSPTSRRHILSVERAQDLLQTVWHEPK